MAYPAVSLEGDRVINEKKLFINFQFPMNLQALLDIDFHLSKSPAEFKREKLDDSPASTSFEEVFFLITRFRLVLRSYNTH